MVIVKQTALVLVTKISTDNHAIDVLFTDLGPRATPSAMILTAVVMVTAALKGHVRAMLGLQACHVKLVPRAITRWLVVVSSSVLTTGLASDLDVVNRLEFVNVFLTSIVLHSLLISSNIPLLQTK